MADTFAFNASENHEINKLKNEIFKLNTENSSLKTDAQRWKKFKSSESERVRNYNNRKKQESEMNSETNKNGVSHNEEDEVMEPEKKKMKKEPVSNNKFFGNESISYLFGRKNHYKQKYKQKKKDLKVEKEKFTNLEERAHQLSQFALDCQSYFENMGVDQRPPSPVENPVQDTDA